MEVAESSPLQHVEVLRTLKKRLNCHNSLLVSAAYAVK